MKQEIIDKWYESYWTKLYHIAHAILNNREDSEDAVSNCIVKVITNKVDHIENVGGYLYTIVRNEAFDILRRRKQGPFTDAGSEQVEMVKDDSDLSVQTLKLQAEVYGLLMEEMDRMPAKEREVFMLWLEGKKLVDISVYLDIPYTTVRRYYSNSLKYLIAKAKKKDLLPCIGLILTLLGTVLVVGIKKMKVFLAFFPTWPSYL